MAAATIGLMGELVAIKDIEAGDLVGAQATSDLDNHGALLVAEKLELLARRRGAHAPTHGSCQRPRPWTSFCASSGPHVPGV